MPRRTVILPLCLLLACPAGDDTGTDSGAVATESAGSSSGAATTTSGDATAGQTASSAGSDGDPCAGMEFPLCDYCPSAMGLLCGMPCPEEGYTCSNDIGDGMTCAGGVWECAVHPPLGTGCNAVCVGAEACTEIGCTDGLTIALTPDADGVTAGDYVVTLDLDGMVDTCTLQISDDPMVCAGGAPCVPDTTCNALVLLDTESAISIMAQVAAMVTVTVQRDADPAVEVTDTPAYAVSAPNGSGCPPACAFATVEVAAL